MCLIVCAMDVDIAGMGIDRAASIDARLTAAKPQNARQDPVLIRLIDAVLVDCEWSATPKCGKDRHVSANFCFNAVFSERRLEAVHPIAGASFCCRDWIGVPDTATAAMVEFLVFDRDHNHRAMVGGSTSKPKCAVG